MNWKWKFLLFVGPMLGISREMLAHGFITASNALMLKQKHNFKGEELLLLAPHCLQKDSCVHKITRHLENCRQCGGCKIGELKALQEKSMEEMGIPTVYGLDMIHGATYLDQGTFFPQEVNLAATFNPEHAANMGRILAYETRSMQVPWVFSPVMDLGRNPLWPRQYESWGEDPCVQTVMAEAETRASQGPDYNNVGFENVAVSIKHYMAYGVPATGKDRTPAYIPDYELREFCGQKIILATGMKSVDLNTMLVLNDTAAYMWEAMGNGDIDTADVVAKVVAEYDIAPEHAASSLTTFIAQLQEHNIVM